MENAQTFIDSLLSVAKGRVRTSSSIVSFGTDAVLVAPGDAPTSLLVLRAGFVRLQVGETVLAVLGPGDAVEPAAVFSGEPHCVLATALSSDVVALRIDARALRDGGEMELASSAWTRLLARQAQHLEGKVDVVTSGRAERRLARLVTELVARFGQRVKGGWFIPLRLSRRDAAGLTGLTTETASRVMSSWHKRHLVVSVPEGAYVDEMARLEACAHSCQCRPEKRRKKGCLACR